MATWNVRSMGTGITIYSGGEKGGLYGVAMYLNFKISLPYI